MMCDACLVEPSATTKKSAYRIWELSSAYHCGVVGNCLTLAELKKMRVRFALHSLSVGSDYNLHHFFVQQVGDDNPIARYINKLLGRKYALGIKQLGKVSSPTALLEYWQAQWLAGKFLSALWPVMSHPCADVDVWRQVHADVHMLSHQLAQEQRQQQQQFEQWQAQQQQLQMQYQQLQRRYAERLQELVKLRDELQQQALLRQKWVLQQTQPTRPTQPAARLTDEAQRAVLQRRLQQLEDRNQALQQENRDLQARFLFESQALEDADEVTSGQGVTDVGAEQALSSKLLYVGGTPRAYPKIRALVEQYQGHCQFHDGGLEESSTRLDELLRTADCVFCPVDCVSHEACLKVKKYCKRNQKRFVPLRSSGVSAFSRGLQELLQAG